MKKSKIEAATIPVTLRALTQRINRKLAKQGKHIRRGYKEFVLIDDKKINSFWLATMGERKYGELVEKDVDVVKLADKIGVLRPWERIEKSVR
jgi:hypothetical protein